MHRSNQRKPLITEGDFEMAIVARSHKGQLDAAETAAVRKFFENPALDSRYQEHNANQLEDYMYRWGVVIDAESLAVAFQKLSEAGVLKLRSVAQQKYDVAVQGYTQAHQDVLDAWLKRNHLVHDPTDDRTFDNCAEIFKAMKGREFNDSNLSWCRDYLIGKGIKLHFEERPSQRTSRGHTATSPNDFRWAPKEDSNHGPLSRHSHSNDPRFNGELDRQKMRLPGTPESDLMASHNHVWMMQARALQGQNHAETQRVQKIVSSTPGGGRAAYEAGKAEQRRIENERARGR
jgi:hypothetical protein